MSSVKRHVAVAVAALALLAPTGAAANNDVFAPQAHPYGQSYGQWAADWWTWALEQPAPTNPLLDTTGARCANHQSGRVWFLAGTTISGQRITRRCSVPKNTALLFPIVNNSASAYGCDDTTPPGCVPDGPEWYNVSYLRAVLDDNVKPQFKVDAFRVTIDGCAVAALAAYYEESTVFRVALPDDDLFNQPRGWVFDPIVDVGYYLMVKPLSKGAHTIHFEGAIGEFTINVTYLLTVQR